MFDAAVDHLRALLAFDTTNPSGNETIAAQYLVQLLASFGIESSLLGAESRRQNVVARLKGDGSLPPLLLSAHLDVVPADVDAWQVPPFAGVIKDGYLWGRGAIDMKNMAVMSCLVMGRLAQEGVRLKRDIIFAGVADEEAGCDLGSRWLVENHPDLVRAEYALGEAGGFTVYFGGQALYPIQVAEKGAVWMRLQMRGTPGHGSMPKGDNVVGKIGGALAKLATTRLPQHRTQAAAEYLQALSRTQKFPVSFLVRHMHIPWIANLVLKLLPDRGVAAALAAVLSNTAVPTVVRAGSSVNVIPGHAEAQIDGRTLPEQTAQDLIREIKAVIEEDVEIEILRDLPPVQNNKESALWTIMEQAIARHHPGAQVVPYLAPGFTDAKYWSRLGCKCYGFVPCRFENDGVKFSELFHGHNERIPVAGLTWGTQVLYEVVKEFCA